MEINDVTDRIIGAAIRIHRLLGPGLLESTYQKCMELEMKHLGLPFKAQHALIPAYRGVPLDIAYKIDLLVDDRVIVEIKSIARFDPIHFAQTLTYLKLSGCQVALLINFNVPVLKNGVKRMVNNLPEPIRKEIRAQQQSRQPRP